MNKIIVTAALLSASLVMMAQDLPIDPDKTAQYFKEIKEICDQDNGSLWGENLWAPILLIDNESRFIVASEPDNEGLLEKRGSVYTGWFPKDKGVANSTTDFGGRHWMMVMHPLPEDDYSRNQLCIHELFHSLQQRMNLSFGNPDNSHLDNMDARVLLKLEWTALGKAVMDETGKRKGYLRDALVFRNYRRALYPGKAKEENELEIQEGLAEYTGHKLCSKSDEEFAKYVLKVKDNIWNNQTYVRSFAYSSGSLYGKILDRGKDGWRTSITPSGDLGAIMQESFGVVLPENLEKAYNKLKNRYNYEEIYRFEADREEKRQMILTGYRNRFTRDTILMLDVPNPKVMFDPRTLIPLDTLGTVYPTIKIIADWGILQVNEGGCLFDWRKAIVSGKAMKKENNRLTGDGWEIELAENWNLVPEGRVYRLIEEKELKTK